MNQLEKLQKEYDRLRSRCDVYREKYSCGMPTIFTMGCGECVLSWRMRGIRSKMKEVRGSSEVKRMSKTKVQKEMQEFVNVWTKVGKPVTKEWYDAFRKYTCPNEEHANACRTGYCPMGEEDCCMLIDKFS